MIAGFPRGLRFCFGALVLCASLSPLLHPARAQNAQVLKDNGPAAVPPGIAAPCGAGATVVSLSSRSPRPLSAAEECALKPMDVFKECAQCPEMVLVPAGRFTMGSPESEKGRRQDEGPQHVVTIAKPFAVGKFHVTVEQFAAFVAETGFDAGKCHVLEGGVRYVEHDGRSWRNPGFPGLPQSGAQPAVCLNPNDAKAYVDWLSRKTGKTYRLLSESEWEYAARAGSTTAYPWGDDIGRNNANCIDCGSAWENKLRPAPVGSFAANAFGLHDMHGNVWEWLADCYHDNYAGAQSDGSAWTGGDCRDRVLRGGSWDSFPEHIRSASRLSSPFRFRRNNSGLRVARTL